MATKWKNKTGIMTVFCLTLGLTGMFIFFDKIYIYFYNNYFDTINFNSELNYFIDYLYEFELYREEIEESGGGHREGGEAVFNELSESFAYYLVDENSGDVYTNVEKDSFNDDKMLMIKKWPYEYNHPIDVTVEGEVQTIFKEFDGQIGLLRSAPENSAVMTNYKAFKSAQKIFFTVGGIGALLLILGLLLFRRWNVEKGGYYPYLLKLPIDVQLMITLLGLFVTYLFLGSFSNKLFSFNSMAILEAMVLLLTFGMLLMACVTILGKILFLRTQNIDSLIAEFQRSLISSFYQTIKITLLKKSIGIQVLSFLLLIMAFIPAGIFLAKRSYYWFTLPNMIYLLLFVLIALPAAFKILKWSAYFNQILSSTSEMTKGNFGKDIEVLDQSPLSELALNINTIKQGAKSSVLEQQKSERLKTELITNVSHDLRTPLTSIITYSDLLKSSNVSDDERNSYVEIINRKSKRLKVLIEDLFEASKMASGNIDLTKEKIDLVQLLEQALAEHEENIQASSLQFRIKKPDESLYVNVDGQKIWRVFDNLIGNILKYSLDNTRVFITLEENQNQAQVTFKNISKYELGSDADDFFERFKRGDSSRHTEGSGLGLSIAKSIIDLHDGHMNIEVDGDLFKIIVTLPM